MRILLNPFPYLENNSGRLLDDGTSAVCLGIVMFPQMFKITLVPVGVPLLNILDYLIERLTMVKVSALVKIQKTKYATTLSDDDEEVTSSSDSDEEIRALIGCFVGLLALISNSLILVD